jgi:hypothetical protein
MLSATYDYTPFVLRTDPDFPCRPVSTTAFLVDLDRALAGAFTSTLPIIASIWAQVSPDATGLAAMTAVLDGFTDRAEAARASTWKDIDPDLITSFLASGDTEPSDDTRRLRKNVIHGAYLALRDARVGYATSPAEGIDPVAGATRHDERGKRRGNAAETKTRRPYGERVHVRPATHDEMLIIRLGARLAGSSRARHLSAAAVALTSASATTAEAVQVVWADTKTNCVPLAGRVAEDGREETAITPRVAELDEWGTDALNAWRDEKCAVRPFDPQGSVLYGGNDELTSNTAQVCVDQQVRKALQIADLRREPGLTAGSLRLWAGCRRVTDFASLAVGAEIAGVDPLTLHRQVTRQGERGLRRNS